MMSPSQPPAIDITFRDIAKLNNRGARYLKDGRCNSAMKKFREAMKLTTRYYNLENTSEEPNDQVDNDHADESVIHKALLDCSDDSFGDMIEESSTEVTESGTKCLLSRSRSCRKKSKFREFIYREPIWLLMGRRTMPSCSELGLTLTFNLALSEHMKMLEKKEFVSKRRLHKIRKLYELASFIELQKGIALSPSHSLAILNNIAQVYKMIGREEKSVKLLRRLLHTIVYLVENGNSGEVDQFDGFFQNVFHFLVKPGTVAAAA